MKIQIQGAHEHNLQGVEVEFGEGLTVVTGISGSGKTSLVFDTLYHEARRRFLEVFELGSPKGRLAPANVDAIVGLGPAVAVGQNLLNRNPNSTLATASGLHPFLRLLYAHFGERSCPRCGMSLAVYTDRRDFGAPGRGGGSRGGEYYSSVGARDPGQPHHVAVRVGGLFWNGTNLGG